MQPETLKRLIDEYLKVNSPDGLSEHIVELLGLEKEIRSAVSLLMVEQETEVRRRDEFSQNMRKRWADVQDKCPHWEHTYHGDPSGGRDSFEECNLCKKQW